MCLSVCVIVYVCVCGCGCPRVRVTAPRQYWGGVASFFPNLQAQTITRRGGEKRAGESFPTAKFIIAYDSAVYNFLKNNKINASKNKTKIKIMLKHFKSLKVLITN